MNRSLSLAALLAACVVVCSSGQMPLPKTSEIAQHEMSKLRFLAGTWRGEGWMEFRPGHRQTFRSSEKVELKLDGLVLVIEGTHYGRIPGQADEIKLHHAVGIVTYDESSKDYRFLAYKADGKSVDARGEFREGAFIWSFSDPRLGHVRFTIRRTPDGRWSEIGERSADGTRWTKYFEMNLSKL